MHSDPLDPHAMGERLRALPLELPPPANWAQLRSRMAESPANTASPWRYAALAAGIAVVMAGVALWSRIQLPADPGLSASAQAELPMLSIPDPRFIAQAEASERWLARLPAEPAVMRVGTRVAVADLEDRIAWMDDVLSAERLEVVNPQHIVALQHERARLVNSLAQVRYAEQLVAAAQ